ncbi:MAG: SDR family oxidoreductase [Cyclobacteriaceae bacterium]|nr:SDR family oxidoreductase [Cyclobacteriaceae bacterium]
MKKAIITGASKGLGKALSHELCSRGYEVLLVARSEELLASLAEELTLQYSVKAHYLTIDLALAEAIDQVAQWCESNKFQPSVLANNAGFACWGYFDKLPLPKQLDMLQLNMQSMVALTYRLLPLLRGNEQAYILNVCSTSAYQSVPTLTLYSASKAFVRSFSRGLRYELRKSNVSVTCLSPGPMSTHFLEEANMRAMESTAKKFEMSPELVARQGISAMLKRRPEVIPGFTNFITVAVSKFIPDAWLERIAANLYESKL